MMITSNWPIGEILWRAFDQFDTVYVVPHREGILAQGATGTYDHPSGKFQLEIRQHAVFGRVIVQPGRVFDNADDLVVMPDGRIVPRQPVTLDLSDGRVYRESSDPRVYVIYGGAKIHIPDPATLFRLFGGWGVVQVVPDGTLAVVPTVPRNNTVLKEWDDAYIWTIDNGQKRHITAPHLIPNFGGWEAVKVVPDGAMNAFPTGAPIF
jgi:hypothetical protein